jgi:hypothetical protein
VLGHDDVSVDAKAEAVAHALKGVLKDSSARVGREQGMVVITTKGSCPLKPKPGLNGPPAGKGRVNSESKGRAPTGF